MSNSYLFSSESVGEGHPDKVADAIADSILDECLTQDRAARVAVEVLVKSDHVVIAGEVTTQAQFDAEKIARQTIRDIGYVYPDCIFHADKISLVNYLAKQSPDIAQGVDARAVDGKATAEQGAGDQGIMFGYACNETPELMPAAVMYAHAINRKLSEMRRSGRVRWLRPDCKSQVALRYENGRPVEAAAIVCSTQHADEIGHAEIENFVMTNIIPGVFPKGFLGKNTKYYINPTGRFVIGGPEGDAGVTGRKIIVDTYGGASRHGGGAFSGKDPSKVDRSAAYMCRWVAKNVVAAGLAGRCELQVAYAIGYPEPVSIMVETFGTAKVAEDVIAKAVSKVFSFKPANIISQLDLLRPIYRQTTNYGHFGKPSLPWEQTNKVESLKKAL
jgi:S-adenosylmethionine synthetase